MKLKNIGERAWMKVNKNKTENITMHALQRIPRFITRCHS
jgi:hypothetical protein